MESEGNHANTVTRMAKEKRLPKVLNVKKNEAR